MSIPEVERIPKPRRPAQRYFAIVQRNGSIQISVNHFHFFHLDDLDHRTFADAEPAFPQQLTYRTYHEQFQVCAPAP